MWRAWGRGEVCTGFWWGILWERIHWEDPDRWEDNIKMDLQELGGDCGDWMDLAQDRERYGNELSGSIKCGEFLD
jgi:hypothetical protein